MSDPEAGEAYVSSERGGKKKGVLERKAEGLDYQNRDPNQLNSHCQTHFDDIIGEPDGTHTPANVYVTSFKAYWAGKICCHTVMSYLCAVPCSFIWGCVFVCISFSQIYHVTPCIRAFNMCFSCVARLYSTIVHCCYDPISEAMSLCLTKIFVTQVAGGQAYRPITYDQMESYNQMEKEKNSV